MDFLLEDYGQSIILIIFGGGVVTVMGNLLNWVIMNGIAA